MVDYRVFENSNLFGIKTSTKEVVPPTHTTKKDAIEECIYFLKLNNKEEFHKKFLSYSENYTLDQINEIEKQLLSQI